MTKTCNKQNHPPKTSQNEFHIIDQKDRLNWYLDNVHKTLSSKHKCKVFKIYFTKKNVFYFILFFLKIQIKEPRIQIAQVENLKIKGFD